MSVLDIISKKTSIVHLLGAIIILSIISILAIWQPESKAIANNHTYVTVHYDGTEQTLATDAKTVGELLDRADIRIDKHDDVQPSLSTELTSNDYNVNVYRARPVTVVDNGERYKVVTAAQSPKKMAEHAGLKIYTEDTYQVNRIDNFLSEGSLGLRVDIDRSIPLTLDQYGEKTQVRTQATTVSEFLSEKGLQLQEGDKLEPVAETPITKDMTIRLIQNGIKVITVEEEIPFPTEQIQDAEKEVDFKEIKEPGKNGLKKVTYEVVIENGIEVGRKEINSLEIKAARVQKEIVGTKPSFSGDFAEALAKLRSCEGGYDSWNPAGPYYGAYQFGEGTWASVADPAKYGNATPAEQDEAARALYERRGWQPWPVCGADLPDIYR